MDSFTFRLGFSYYVHEDSSAEMGTVFSSYGISKPAGIRTVLGL